MRNSAGNFMHGRIAKKLIMAVLLVSIVFVWILPVFAEETLTTFREAFSFIMDNYVEQPDASYLVSGAMSGIKNLLDSKNRSFTPPQIDANSIKGDRMEAVKIVEDTVERSISSGIDPIMLEQAALDGMFKSLDPHSGYLTPDAYRELTVETRGEFAGIGIQVAIKEEVLTVISPIEDSPAYRAGIKPGDRVLQIDNEPTKGMSIEGAVKKIRGIKGTSVVLSIMRNGFGGPRRFEITRDVIRIKSVKTRVLEEGIGYIRISSFQENTSHDVESALNGLGSREGKLKGLVLDLRNNPGGLLMSAVDVADKFIDADLIVYTKGRTSGSNMRLEGKTMGTHPPYPIIVLANEGSASGAEILAGALQDLNKAVVLGKRTFGKGTVQTIFLLKNGSAVKLTTAKYYLPSGKAVQGGIFPDSEVEEKEGSDLPLNVAQHALRDSKGVLSKDRLKKMVDIVLKENATDTSKPAYQEQNSADTTKAAFTEKLPPLRSDTFAIVIGIDYKGRPDMPHLQYASQDAKKVYSILSDPRYGGVPKENTIFLINEQATTNNIKAALRKIKNWDGYVYVYFSGHGAPGLKDDKSTDGFLVPYDVVLSDPEAMEDTSIKISYLRELIKGSQAKGLLVAIDACFTGGGKSITPKGGKPLVVMMSSSDLFKTSGTGKVIITSSAANQQSWEDETELKSGIFSHYFLEGLRGKAGKDAWVNVDELSDYIKENVPKAARKFKGAEQTPYISGKGDFAVTRNWERAKIMDIETGRSKLKDAFEKGLITTEQLSKAMDELKSKKKSKTLEAFLEGKIDEKKFGELY